MKGETLSGHTCGPTAYGDTKMTAGDESTACYISPEGGVPLRVHVRAGVAVRRIDTIEGLLPDQSGRCVETITVEAGESLFFLPIEFARAIAYRVEQIDREEAEAAECAKHNCDGDHSNIIRSVN